MSSERLHLCSVSGGGFMGPILFSGIRFVVSLFVAQFNCLFENVSLREWVFLGLCIWLVSYLIVVLR